MHNSEAGEPLRVAIIGGGRIGRVHAQSLVRAGANVVTVWACSVLASLGCWLAAHTKYGIDRRPSSRRGSAGRYAIPHRQLDAVAFRGHC